MKRPYILLLLFLFHDLFSGDSIARMPPLNRMQYHIHRWQILTTPAFHIVFPRGYDSLASLASVQLPGIMEEIKEATGMLPEGVPHFIIYPSIDQLYQTNIGADRELPLTFPMTEIKGRRMLVAFDGSYSRLIRQLRTAVVRMVWEQYSYKGKEEVPAEHISDPDWFIEGLLQYWADGWTIEDEEQVCIALEDQGDMAFTIAQPVAAKAFCYFLTRRYRSDALKQILYQLRQGKKTPSAIRLITKRNMETLKQECVVFFTGRCRSTASFRQTIPEAYSDTLFRSHIEHAGARRLQQYPDKAGSHIAIVTEKDNKRNIYIAGGLPAVPRIYPVCTYVMPPWLQQHDPDPYPLLLWQSDGRLVVVFPEKGKLKIRYFNPDGTFLSDRTLYGVDGVESLARLRDGRLLLSAYRKGKSDIISFDARSLKIRPLTAGTAEYTQLHIDAAGRQLSYRSGYPSDPVYHPDSLSRSYGVYIQSLHDTAGSRLILGDTLYRKSRALQFTADGNIVIAHTGWGILRTDTFPASGIDLPRAPFVSPWVSDFMADRDSAVQAKGSAPVEEPSVLQGILSAGHTGAGQDRDSLLRALAYHRKRVKPYLIQLYSAYFSAKVNNDYFINRYQPYKAYLGTFKFPDVGGMALAGFSDLFEHHHFNAGYRMPVGINGSDFFLRYENKARLVDWHLLFFRKVERLAPDADRGWKDALGRPYPAAARVKTHYYELGFHYPLSYNWSLGLDLALRRDRTIFLATEQYSLTYADLQQWWNINTFRVSGSGLRATANPMLYRGWTAGLLLDGMVSTGRGQTMLYSLQASGAWHQPLGAMLHFVSRGQLGYSGGNNYMLFNFGGQDNNLAYLRDTSVRFGQDEPYAFQTLVTPFRGYAQNSLYGHSYALFNADLYGTFFHHLPVPFAALKQLQLGVLTDVAAARRLPSASFDALWSWGFSARTRLAGYPLRFDIAWPAGAHAGEPPVWALSLSLQ